MRGEEAKVDDIVQSYANKWNFTIPYKCYVFKVISFIKTAGHEEARLCPHSSNNVLLTLRTNSQKRSMHSIYGRASRRGEKGLYHHKVHLMHLW